MVAIWSVWYNFIRIHKTLGVTPAMAAGVSKTVMNRGDIVSLMGSDALKGTARGPYKKKAVNAEPQTDQA
jgi:ABC-type microcin C transport system duplicated ATPase subunit YejF